MKIAEQTPERLIVEAGDHAFARILLALAVAAAACAVIMLLVLPRAWRIERFQGLVAAAVLFLGGFFAVFERATFVFDRGTRTLTWRRKRALRNTSGAVRFEAITDVVLQTAIGNAINPARRIALLLREGELPLETAYAPDPDGRARTVAATVRTFVGLPSAS